MAEPRARPTPELLERLRAGKREIHAEQRDLSLPEKIEQLLALQRIDYEVRRSRGAQFQPWERPWDIEP
jgi:hypothetical protein